MERRAGLLQELQYRAFGNTGTVANPGPPAQQAAMASSSCCQWPSDTNHIRKKNFLEVSTEISVFTTGPIELPPGHHPAFWLKCALNRICHCPLHVRAQSVALVQEGLWEEQEGLSRAAPNTASSEMGRSGGDLFPCEAAAAVAEGPTRVPWDRGLFADCSPHPLGTQPSPKTYKPKKHKQMIT